VEFVCLHCITDKYITHYKRGCIYFKPSMFKSLSVCFMYVKYYHISSIFYIYKNECLCVCPGITLECLERFRPKLVHILLYACVRILCMFYIFRIEDGVGGREFGLLLLIGNHLKHIRGNVSYLVKWNVKGFTVGYSTE
jgi:hypothetical protein